MTYMGCFSGLLGATLLMGTENPAPAEEGCWLAGEGCLKKLPAVVFWIPCPPMLLVMDKVEGIITDPVIEPGTGRGGVGEMVDPILLLVCLREGDEEEDGCDSGTQGAHFWVVHLLRESSEESSEYEVKKWILPPANAGVGV